MQPFDIAAMLLQTAGWLVNAVLAPIPHSYHPAVMQLSYPSISWHIVILVQCASLSEHTVSQHIEILCGLEWCWNCSSLCTVPSSQLGQSHVFQGPQCLVGHLGHLTSVGFHWISNVFPLKSLEIPRPHVSVMSGFPLAQDQWPGHMAGGATSHGPPVACCHGAVSVMHVHTTSHNLWKQLADLDRDPVALPWQAH